MGEASTGNKSVYSEINRTLCLFLLNVNTVHVLLESWRVVIDVFDRDQDPQPGSKRAICSPGLQHQLQINTWQRKISLSL